MDRTAGGPGLSGLSAHLADVLVGHERLIERLLTGILAGGHLLVEGAPGLAKTRAVKALAGALDGSFARVQCTPDLLPSDLTGTPVFRPQTGDFEFVPGPIFHNLVLVDEINRAPPKVQSALLEAMGEGQVTSGNATHALPDPFLVVATQNPIEHEGTFPLPEAQLDRFLLHVMLDLPDAETERRILDLVEAEGQGEVEPMPAVEDIREARKAAMATHLSGPIRDYIVRLVTATRAAPFVGELAHPASPRGSLALAAASKARAWLKGRDHVLPEDVDALAEDALAHRLVLTWQAQSEGRSPRALVADLLAATDPL
ncbi:MoxR family ATPase [Oceanicola sp. 502str15]|uniref:AAA family ATPase n=1 Tax=Oceanicola sp. 502str15 TaxID=2696061 RepID=UPI0020964AC7|nr:MoxR family ATPase [Oceanicola sp. 502str15]MCO6382079.1 AAA domain-containing protein [Oceanicola sp. 502str15]